MTTIKRGIVEYGQARAPVKECNQAPADAALSRSCGKKVTRSKRPRTTTAIVSRQVGATSMKRRRFQKSRNASRRRTTPAAKNPDAVLKQAKTVAIAPVHQFRE